MQQQPRLSKERILQTALDIADEEGLDALSMRRLAQALDVWPMSVYRYFQDKDALLDAMAAHSAAPSAAAPDADASWRDRLKALLREAQRQITASPEIGSRIPRAFLEPEPLRLTEAGIGILREAGFTTAQAASAWRALYSYTFGFATFRLAPTPEEAGRRVRVAVAGLPKSEYPAIAEAADDLGDAFATDEFDFGIDRLLDGLEARLTSAA